MFGWLLLHMLDRVVSESLRLDPGGAGTGGGRGLPGESRGGRAALVRTPREFVRFTQDASVVIVSQKIPVMIYM